MTRTARITVMVRKYTGSTEDAHGNDQKTWAAPAARLVFACAPKASGETFEVARDDDGQFGWEIFAPVGTDIESDDRVDFAGKTLDVVGPAEVWTHPSTGVNKGQVHNLEWKGAING